MQIKMIVVDLDKTLLHNDETLSQLSIDVIKRYQDRGVLLVIATSRSLSSAKRYADVLVPDAIISSGGALAMVGFDTIYEASLSAEIASNYVKRCLKEPTIDFIRVIGEKVDLTNNPNIEFGQKEYGHYIRTSYEREIDQKVRKISLYSENVTMIRYMFGDDDQCSVITSYAGKCCHKITHPKATKEDALFKVANYFGIGYDNILSFGDDTSDIKMLSLCGIGVAVKNASTSVKAVADEMCDENEENGVAKYLLMNYTRFLGVDDEKR